VDGRTRWAFVAVIAAQAVHSLEEYATRLFDVFGPARAVSGLFSRDPATGFAVANAAIVALGVGCAIAVVKPGRALAVPVAWLWAVLELANGIGHVLLAAVRGGYFPGVATAPLLILGAGYLGHRLTRQQEGC
jgi:hypothetical protein